MSSMSQQEIVTIRKQQRSLGVRGLPAISKQMIPHAEMPSLYKKARLALQQCCRLDEVKEVKNRHEAIAVYAKQVKDTTLLYYAERIKLRAMERIGELLSELPEGKERDDAAKSAGISASVRNRAVEMALVPPKVRTTLIESSPPPSYRTIAQHGVDGYGDGKKFHVYQRNGFSNFVHKEDEIRPSIKCAAYKLHDALSKVFEELDECRNDGFGGKHSIRDMAIAIHKWDARSPREYAEKISVFVDTVLMYLPNDNEDES